MSGGSRVRSMAGERAQSQARKATSTAQKTAVRNGAEERIFVMARGLADNSSTQKPKCRRTRTPISVPANAIGTQIQPCRLLVEMPLSMAPTLQPKARRER